jgi:antitoxin ParD1/3/4
MAVTEKRTFDIAADDGRYLDDLVATGAYASSGEAIGAALRAFKEREAAVDRWFREEVLPTVDLMETEPERTVPASEVFDSIRALHRARLAES